MLKEKYTLRDAANHREPRQYAQKILRSAKDVEMTVLQTQLDLIYNGIDTSLVKGDLKALKADLVTLKNFLKQLDDCKDNW